MALTDTDLIENKDKQEDFDLEEIFILFEKTKLKYKLDKSEASKIETKLTSIDRYFQDLMENPTSNSINKMMHTKRLLRKWFTKDINNNADVLSSFYQNMYFLEKEIEKTDNLLNFSKKEYSPNEKISKEDFTNSILSSLYKENNKLPKLNFIPQYYWIINIKFSDETVNLVNVSKYLYIFSNSIEAIYGCQLIIEEIKLGSLFIKIKLFFKNLLAKEETKELFENGMNAINSKLEQVTLEKENAKKDVEIKELEKKIIEKQLDNTIDKDITREREELINEKLKLEIANKRIETMQNLSNLLASETYNQSNIQIDINDILYFKSDEKNKTICKKKDIVSIDNNTKKIE